VDEVDASAGGADGTGTVLVALMLTSRDRTEPGATRTDEHGATWVDIGAGDWDRQGRPFVGRAGQLLDQMFAAIGLSRQAVDAERALYITNVLPWRPPGNRRPEQAEIDAMLPFVARHVELAAPDVLVLMGNTPCQAALGRQGILRLRGQWAEGFGRPVLPMTHPAYVLRNPIAKRDSWADLLSLQARLQAGSQP